MGAHPDKLALALNESCRCEGADVPALQETIESQLDAGTTAASLAQSHPHLFTSVPFFVSDEQFWQMQRVIKAVESVIALPAYRELISAAAPAVARNDVGPRGGLLGYDFHLTDDGPQLIEINTNAGGAMLNVQLLEAQLACCEPARHFSLPTDAGQVAADLVAMFRREWQLARGDAPLHRLAIVDEEPTQQYLYPEFLLFKNLLQAHGIETVIADPTQLQADDRRVRLAGQPIDLLYNRLTDFYFDLPRHAHLRTAYLHDAAVFTPHPRSHALYADKRNLIRLTDEQTLRRLGAADSVIDTLLHGIPQTLAVRPGEAEHWWTQRKQWFFKPASGHGSRGVYRGDKLTRSTFAAIVNGDYVAQRVAGPSTRSHVDGPLKADIRHYVYEGRVHLVAARLYRGQTTNFRTPQGGFAPVFFASASRVAALQTEAGGSSLAPMNDRA